MSSWACESFVALLSENIHTNHGRVSPPLLIWQLTPSSWAVHTMQGRQRLQHHYKRASSSSTRGSRHSTQSPAHSTHSMQVKQHSPEAKGCKGEGQGWERSAFLPLPSPTPPQSRMAVLYPPHGVHGKPSPNTQQAAPTVPLPVTAVR